MKKIIDETKRYNPTKTPEENRIFSPQQKDELVSQTIFHPKISPARELHGGLNNPIHYLSMFDD